MLKILWGVGSRGSRYPSDQQWSLPDTIGRPVWTLALPTQTKPMYRTTPKLTTWVYVVHH